MRENTMNGELLCRMLLNGFTSLSQNKDYLDDLNVFPVSDNDTGTNMKNTFEKGVAALIDEPSFHSVFSAFVKGMLIGSKGNSGLILSQYFLGIHEYTMGKEYVTSADLSGALQHAYDLAYGAVLQPADGTMLTVMRDAINRALPNITEKTSVKEFFDIIVEEMFLSTQETVMQMNVLRENNVVDSGALGLYLIFDGMKRTLHDDVQYFDCEQSELLPKRIPNSVKSISFFRYCTEFILKKHDANGKDYFVQLLEKRGESIVVAENESILKVHIHTNKPQEIMDEFSNYGSIAIRKVDDLFLTQEFEKLKQRMHKDYAVVAFTSGDGNATILERLGADVAFSVPSDYTPDENEIKMLVDEFMKENLIVFPGNKEMQEMFERIKWYSNLKNLYVVETDSLPKTFFTLSSLIFDEDFASVIRSLNSLKKQQVFIANITSTTVENAEDAENNVQYSAKLKSEIITKSDLAVLLNDVANEEILRPYSTVVIFGGKNCNSDEVGCINDHFEKNSDIEFTYFDGRQSDCDFIIGAY